MPKSLERAVKRRGGVKRIRTIKLKNGRYIRVFVVKKKGPRGGHTIGMVKKRGRRG